MRMLSDTLAAAAGVVDQGSAAPATAPPMLATPLSASTTMAGFFVDARMGLALGALLCALVGTVYLLQCALHYCGGRRRNALPPAAGLKLSELKRMPVAVYEAAAEGGAPAGAECAICLGEFEDGDAVRLLPRCHHGFHVHCIDTWLSAHSSCPICRDSLLDEGASATAAGEDTTAWSSFVAGMLYLA